MTTIQKLCGCYVGWTGCKWGQFDHEKPIEHVRYRILTAWERLADWPRQTGWRIADRLARLVNWLRGHSSENIHYTVHGNKAESLSENIRWVLITGDMEGPVTLERETVDGIFEDLEKLSQLARATWWHDMKRIEEPLEKLEVKP